MPAVLTDEDLGIGQPLTDADLGLGEAAPDMTPPPFESPLAITDHGPIYQSDVDAQKAGGSISTSDLSLGQRFRRSDAGERLMGPTPEEVHGMGGSAGSRVGVLPVLGATSPLLPVGLGGAAGKALMTYFAADFAKQQPEVYRQAKAAADRGDWSEFGKIVGEDAFGAAMTGLGLRQVFTPGGAGRPMPDLETMKRANVPGNLLAERTTPKPVVTVAPEQPPPGQRDLSPQRQIEAAMNEGPAQPPGVPPAPEPPVVLPKPVAPPAAPASSVAAHPVAESKPEVATLATSKSKNKLGDPLGTTYHATPEDWAKWQEVASKPLTDEGVWQAREAIKNAYGGMPPEAPKPAAQTSPPTEPAPPPASAPEKAAEPVPDAADKVEQALAPVRITTEGVPSSNKGAKQARTILLRELQKLHDEAPTAAQTHGQLSTKVSGEMTRSKPESPLEKVTIDIPGDGEFTVFKTKENLEYLLKRARGIKTTPPKGFKESLPAAGIPPDVWVQSSEPTHMVEFLDKNGKPSTLPGKPVTFDAKNAKGKEFYLTSDGETFGVREARTGAGVGKLEDTASAAMKGAKEHLESLKDVDRNIKDFIEKHGERTKPKPITPKPKPAAPVQGTASLVNPPNTTIELGAGISLSGVTDAVKAAVKALDKTRDTIKTLAKTKGVRAVMAYTEDVAGNVATVYGQRVGNNVRGNLRRAMGRGTTPNPLDENALTFVRESNGDRGQLAVMRGKVSASTLIKIPGLKAETLAAIDHADKNWDRLNPIASQYEVATHTQIASENSNGIPTIERPGYVMHAQDIENDFGFFSDVAGEGGAGFKHARVHDTFADSIAAGVNPKTINSITLLTQRVARGQMLINNRAWVEGLKTTVDPQTRKSVITEPEVVPRGPGLPPDVRAPKDYVTEIAGGRPIAVLKSYAGIFRALTEPSKFSESLGWNATLKVATTGKHVALMLDTFHLGRIAFWESVIKPLSFTDPKLPLPSYKRGVLTLDYSRAELQRMAASGEINPAHLTAILDAQKDVNGLVKNGYNVAKISDMLHQEWLQQIPITGQFNKWLFNQFQRGAMAEVGSLEVGRYRRMHPSWTDQQVYREVAKDLNTRFGNLGRQGIFKSKTAQDTARLLALAPQWNEGLIRSEIGAVTGSVKGIGSSIKEGRPSFGILPRAVGAMLLGQFIANQIINYITRGKPTWENEEEGIGAKLSAWVPDVVGGGPGFFLHPAGLAAEVTHLLSQKYEKKGDLREALLAFVGGRYSTLARPLVTFLTRHDVFGKLIRPENIWKETAKSAIPTPIGASAAVPAIKQAVTGQKEEKFPGQYQKQIMASVGVKTDKAPSSRQRIAALAGEFKKAKGILNPGEFYESAYAPLRDQLRLGNRTEIIQTLRDLIKSGHTTTQIENAIKPWSGSNRAPKPFTGSKKNEAEFIGTLNSEQRNAYRKAVIERMKEYQTFQRTLTPQPK